MKKIQVNEPSLFVNPPQMRVLKSDFARYNLAEDEEDGEDADQEENGWKVIQNDVFRFPPMSNLFCAVLG